MEAGATPVDLYATGILNVEAAAGTKVGAGRYTLVKILGRGGMGIVWLARDERLNADVALKFLPAQIRYDAAALDDLRRETARSRQLTHPNIVRIHDLYEAPSEDPFISMEFVEGRNLAELRVEESKRLFTWAFLEPLVQQLCAGLEYAHAEKVIHRDLKPANLMVDAKGRLKLTDFGIARSLTDTMSRNSLSHTSGTLLYMSPQQMEGSMPRVADDIYAVGATLYELLTGKPPFYTGNLMHQVRNLAPKPMQERLQELDLTNDIPRHVERIVLACLSKNAAQRPQSAGELARLFRGDTVNKLKLVTLPATAEKLQLAKLWLRNLKPRTWAGIGAATVIGVACAIYFPMRTGARGKTVATPVPAEKTHVVMTPKAPVAVAPSPVAEKTSNPVVVPSQPVAPPVVAAAPPEPPPVAKSQGSVTRPLAEAAAAPVALPLVTTSVVPEKPAVKEATPPQTKPIVVAAVPQPPPPAPKDIPVALRKPEPTALELLRKGNGHVPARSRDRVMFVFSSRASVDEQPTTWTFRYHDEKARHDALELRFEGGEMERMHEPNRIANFFALGSSKTLDLDKVRVDSPQAIRLAAAACDVEDVVPRFAELKLERGYGGLAVWNVKLFGTVAGRSGDDLALGSIILLAEDGKVLKKDIDAKPVRPAAKK